MSSKASNVWVLKLVSGEEIVARAKYEEDRAVWVAERPYIFQVIPDYQTGNHCAGLGPFFLTDRDADCEFKDMHVVAFIEAPVDLRTSYIKQTTGIEIASSIIT